MRKIVIVVASMMTSAFMLGVVTANALDDNTSPEDTCIALGYTWVKSGHEGPTDGACMTYNG